MATADKSDVMADVKMFGKIPLVISSEVYKSLEGSRPGSSPRVRY